jgi:hypothetical protein
MLLRTGPAGAVELLRMKRRRPLFKAGETVRVRSREEIASLLDSHNKTDGCFFTAQMWQSCGRSFKVIKPVVKVYDEYRAEMCRTKIPLYILERSICSGSQGEFETKCDRSCYLLWHENWLEKVI